MTEFEKILRASPAYLGFPEPVPCPVVRYWRMEQIDMGARGSSACLPEGTPRVALTLAIDPLPLTTGGT